MRLFLSVPLCLCLVQLINCYDVATVNVKNNIDGTPNNSVGDNIIAASANEKAHRPWIKFRWGKRKKRNAIGNDEKHRGESSTAEEKERKNEKGSEEYLIVKKLKLLSKLDLKQSQLLRQLFHENNLLTETSGNHVDTQGNDSNKQLNNLDKSAEKGSSRKTKANLLTSQKEWIIERAQLLDRFMDILVEGSLSGRHSKRGGNSNVNVIKNFLLDLSGHKTLQSSRTRRTDAKKTYLKNRITKQAIDLLLNE